MTFSMHFVAPGAVIALLLLATTSPTMAGTTAYTYDAQGQVKTVVRSNQTVSYSYDAAGNRAAISTAAPAARAAAQGASVPGTAEPAVPVLPQLLNPPASSSPTPTPASSTRP